MLSTMISDISSLNNWNSEWDRFLTCLLLDFVSKINFELRAFIKLPTHVLSFLVLLRLLSFRELQNQNTYWVQLGSSTGLFRFSKKKLKRTYFDSLFFKNSIILLRIHRKCQRIIFLISVISWALVMNQCLLRYIPIRLRRCHTVTLEKS